MQRLRPRCSSHCRSMSPKSYSLPQIVKFQPARIGKIQKLNGKNSNYFQIFRPANILLIVIILNLDYIKGYTQRAKFEFKRFCTKSRFTTQQPNAVYINKIGGEIKFTADFIDYLKRLLQAALTSISRPVIILFETTFPVRAKI